MITDAEVIAKHDKGVRHRASLECKIVNRLLEDAKNAGYTIKIQEYEDEEEPEDGKEPEYEPEEDEPTPEEYPLKPFPVGTGVLVRDPDPMHAGYGVCVGTVKSFTWRSVGYRQTLLRCPAIETS